MPKTHKQPGRWLGWGAEPQARCTSLQGSKAGLQLWHVGLEGVCEQTAWSQGLWAVNPLPPEPMHLPPQMRVTHSAVLSFTLEAHIPRLKTVCLWHDSAGHLHQPAREEKVGVVRAQVIFPPLPLTGAQNGRGQRQRWALQMRGVVTHTYKSTHYSLSTKRRSVKIHPVILKQPWSKLGSSQHLAERGLWRSPSPLSAAYLVLVGVLWKLGFTQQGWWLWHRPASLW